MTYENAIYNLTQEINSWVAGPNADAAINAVNTLSAAGSTADDKNEAEDILDELYGTVVLVNAPLYAASLSFVSATNNPNRPPRPTRPKA